jgi:hypothetical protein
MSEDADREALLALHEAARRAHFGADVEAALADHGDEVLILRDGAMDHVPVATIRETLRGYFAGATFHEWDDLNPPIVDVSEDGTLAWMANRLRVRLTRRDENGEQIESTFIYSGILTYRKIDGRWVRTANASTFAPG